MAEQVIIEFVGDTSKLEDAYNRLNEQVTQSNNLNKDSLAGFQKANADASASFGTVTDSAKQFSDQLRNLKSILTGGVLKSMVSDLGAVNQAQIQSAGTAQNLTASYRQMRAMMKAMGEQAKALAAQSGQDDSQQKIKLSAGTEKQISDSAISFAQKTSDTIFQIENQNRNQRYNAEIALLQKQSAFELQSNNLTQAQKIAIQRKFDKQEAAVKLQQFKADQKAKEEQAAINGALAITTLIASSPMVLGAVPNPAFFTGLATTIATTATNIAAIAAQKPPAFAKGTPRGGAGAPAGMKLVGEEGPELIYTRGGERIIAAPDTAAILAKYDVPALPNVSPAVALRANANYTHPLINEDSLAKKIALEMGKQTKPMVSFDKNGFTAHLINRGSKTTILNNKYKI